MANLKNCKLELGHSVYWTILLEQFATGSMPRAPFCYKMCHQHGSSVANHIWKNSFCHKKQCQRLRMMATQMDRAPCTTAPPAPGSSPTPPNSPPGNSSEVNWINLDSDNPFIRIGNVDGGEFDQENNTDVHGNPGQLAAKQFKVHLDEETAGYIITDDQQPLEREENRSYTPWTLKAEWELVNWLGHLNCHKVTLISFLS